MSNKKRDMNFELLRIISMFLIISSHYILHSGILEKLEIFSANYFIIEIIRAMTRISVNLYVLITGYYMIKSRTKIKRILNLWTTVEFYSIIILILIIIIQGIPSIKDIIKCIMPISSGKYWFATVYVALYLLIPFINKLLKNLTKRQYQILVIILFSILVVMKTIFNSNPYIDDRNGESLIGIIYLYIVGGYIRLHFDKIANRKLCLAVVIASPLLIVIFRAISLKYFGKSFGRLLDFSNIINFTSTICLFLYFKEMQIKKNWANNMIGNIAPLTFRYLSYS